LALGRIAMFCNSDHRTFSGLFLGADALQKNQAPKGLALWGLVLVGKLLCGGLLWAAPLQIVTTTTDLADIAKRVGGDAVSVTALSSGATDPHHVEPRPSMVRQLRHADAIVVVGMDLDGWSDSLIRVSQNPKLQRGSRGYIDASTKITPLEVPVGKIDGRHGDIHLHGNPHYWLDPLNGILIADVLAERFAVLSPEQAEMFRRNAAQFSARIRSKMPQWSASLSALKSQNMVAYHPTWVYFESRFGLRITGYIEPIPGVSPSISDMMALERRMKSEQTRVIIVESYSPKKEAVRLSANTGANVAVLSPSIGSMPGTTDYVALFDYNVRVLEEASRK
jgi:zinc/manganese transport system substrate-binding protein